jgi:invasion protein IalB
MSTDIALPPQVRQASTEITTRANTLAVTTAEEYQIAAELLRSIKTVRDNIAATFDEPIKAAHQAHKAMLEAKKKHEAPLSLAESTVKTKMNAWTTAQERKRREEEARLREQAQKEEEERRLREAQELERQGENQAAEALVSAPVIAPTVVVAKQVPKVEGVSTRSVWRFRIVNEAAVPREYMTVDEKKIGGVVRSLGNKANIPGVEVYEETIVAAKGF